MTKTIFVVALASCVFTSTAADAQSVTDLPQSKNHALSLGSGYDSALTADLIYTGQHVFAAWQFPVWFVAKATLPYAAPDLQDYALSAGLQSAVVSSGWFDLELQAGPDLKSTDNNLYSATALGLHATVLAGHRAARWGVLFEGGYEQLLVTHLTHSDAYRQRVFADAKDGWYSATGGTLWAGLRGGGRLWGTELSLSAGAMSSVELNPHLAPFYFRLGASYAF